MDNLQIGFFVEKKYSSLILKMIKWLREIVIEIFSLMLDPLINLMCYIVLRQSSFLSLKFSFDFFYVYIFSLSFRDGSTHNSS